jgi:hypothetical protein
VAIIEFNVYYHNHNHKKNERQRKEQLKNSGE